MTGGANAMGEALSTGGSDAQGDPFCGTGVGLLDGTGISGTFLRTSPGLVAGSVLASGRRIVLPTLEILVG